MLVSLPYCNHPIVNKLCNSLWQTHMAITHRMAQNFDGGKY